MNSRHDRMRTNVERSRLNSLPDDLIYKILSFISTKDVVELSVLSSRWRYIWRTMPYLDFSRKDFLSQPKFSKFITHFLTYRNHRVDLSSVKFNVCGKFSQSFVSRILNYAFSHSVQKMSMTCMLEKMIEFPLHGFNSMSLKNLTLIGSDNGYSITSDDSWYLPALTTLHLAYVTLTDDKSILLSNCRNLKNLTLSNCSLTGSYCFTIGKCQLCDLLDEDWSDDSDVVAPRLKTLSIINCVGELQICAPDLTSLLYKSQCSLPLIKGSLPSLEKVDLFISKPSELGARKVVDLLEQFNNAKFLKLSLEIVELLSSSVELISHQPSPFTNLTSLKIFPELLSEEASKEVNMSTEVKNYLLNSSPTATFKMITREEARAVRDATSAQNIMAELKVLLEQEKAIMENHKTKMHEEGLAGLLNQREQPGTKVPINIVRACWEDMSTQIQVGRAKTCRIMSILQRIEGLLTKLPTLKRDKMEAGLSSLRIEAKTVMNDIVECVKIQCDLKENRLRDCFSGLATAAQPC